MSLEFTVLYPEMVQRIVDGLVAPYGAHAEVTYERGVPPVVNEPSATALMAAAVRSALGSGFMAAGASENARGVPATIVGCSAPVAGTS